ncbi:haloacid dehalogenase, type II [Salinicola sp. MH3R3-1]|uniref:haloacid dehalogenase type II n=1 Tax=Salinicola sp. MH3R3-1 TaxID=1928762 RepID=UPI00094F2C6B|nr:haloacid dehalogenase type II [Salinicola sp. MH3R3-1]OLO09788.1 haloacid dehalogenase, type II [Salinicola sp. MH3R3-1]
MHLVFDVNETLLDTSSLDPLFRRWFGQDGHRPEWFLTLQEAWMTTNLIGRFEPFAELAKSALRQLGAKHDVSISTADEQVLIEGILTMPAHGDAATALATLRDQGHTLTALTNSALKAAHQQLAHAGLADYFDAILSVESVERYKPSPEPYQHAAAHWAVDPSEMVMIAAHSWDLVGAHAAGLRTGFIARPGKAMDPKIEGVPDWHDDHLVQLVERVASA